MMPTDPLSLFREAIHRFGTEDWDGLAELCDPASLTAFRREFVPRFTRDHESGLTVESLMRLDPEMPREAAEYQIARNRKSSDAAARLLEEVGEAVSLQDLPHFTPRELFAAWLRGQSPRRRIDKLVKEGRLSAEGALATYEGVAQMWNVVPVGVVPDGERVAHILYRSPISPESWQEHEAALLKAGADSDEIALQRDIHGRRSPSVTTCRRGSDGEWRLLAEYGFFGVGSFVFVVDEPNGSAV